MLTSVKYLKDHLSEILKAVRYGEEVCITSHRHPIAKIVPIAGCESVAYDAASFVRELRVLQSSFKSTRNGT